jgi:ABC-2 type transport system ATP-binding protein
MISVQGLSKRYGDFSAVVGSDFEVASGEVFGVVGPNGAGKTTTLKVLSGLIEPSAGTATVAGYDVTEPAMRSSLGFLPEQSPLYEDMTPLSYLRFFADLYDVPRTVATDRIDASLSRLELEHRTRRLGDMSKGMKRKVAIARSLINDPEVLIYDEPASGLDPLTTNEVLEFVAELADEGKTVLFSAHNLYHVEDVCDRVIVMIDGEIVARGTVGEIRATHGTTEYHVYTTVPVEDESTELSRSPGHQPDGEDDTETEADTDVDEGTSTSSPPMRNGEAATTAAEEGASERYETVVPDMAAVEELRERASAAGGEVVDIRTVEPSFEEIFLDIARPSAGAGS